MVKGKTNGIKSSEFYLTAAANIAGFLLMTGVLGQPGDGSLAGQILGVAVALLTTLGYQVNRSSVKKKLVEAEAVAKN